MSDADTSRLRQCVQQFLVHSFLYYRLEESLLSDTRYDALCTELVRLRKACPQAFIPHKHIIDDQLGSEASGFSIKKYPPQIITTAFKLLYATQEEPTLDFAAFVGQRGYQLQQSAP